ncbi:MAG: N-acetyl-gamma-glutamyl-phosphate reductase [Verrucomicrobiota bacterium]
MDRVKTAVIGASGYTGKELLRLLLQHPGVELTAVTSRQYAGQKVEEVFPRFRGAEGAQLTFSHPEPGEVAATGAQVAFLALPHGVASEYARALLEKGLRVLDLSADFRLRDPAIYEEFYGAPHPERELLAEAVYGLPEIYPEEIREARLIASPGCYPTSITLPLWPLLRAGLVSPEGIVANSTSGVSGAGKKASELLLFAECNESVRAYGLPKHRHLSEIEQECSRAAGQGVRLCFHPHLVPINAGICTTTACAPGESFSGKEQVEEVLAEAYAQAPFVRLLGEGGFPDTKQVVGTNFIDIAWAWDERCQRLILLSAEDNLGKGAGGQAVQSFNLACGFEETCGLLHF